MEKTNDTFADSHRATPAWFSALAWLLPLGIFAQFLSAGLGLFLNADLLGLHAAVGISLSLPAIGLFAAALVVPRLRGFGCPAGIVLALYTVQVALAAGAAPVPLSLHPANGALLLTASLALLFKLARRRTEASIRRTAS